MMRKVLLVEAHDSFRRLIGTFLSNKFEVTGTKSGLEAMSCLSQGLLPDAIVADARMADLNSTQFLVNLHYSGMYADIPVVVISSSDNEDEEQHFKQLGVRDYFLKPFSPVKLQECLLQITAQRSRQIKD